MMNLPFFIEAARVMGDIKRFIIWSKMKNFLISFTMSVYLSIRCLPLSRIMKSSLFICFDRDVKARVIFVITDFASFFKKIFSIKKKSKEMLFQKVMEPKVSNKANERNPPISETYLTMLYTALLLTTTSSEAS